MHEEVAASLIADPDPIDLVFEFRTPSEVLRIANELSTYCTDPLDACTAISEIMLNAVEHGNLGIGGELKERLLHTDGLWNEIEMRLLTAPWRDRLARVEFKASADAVHVTITDEGEGFDWRGIPAHPDFSRLNGRGIPLAKALYFDDIRYNDRGNVCRAIKRF
ncbi:MAG: ATP-binding protein [Alphaproteobacteria bacterium]|nr:ATP-binding protein [Alphaproteobacteria bacterium]